MLHDRPRTFATFPHYTLFPVIHVNKYLLLLLLLLLLLRLAGKNSATVRYLPNAVLNTPHTPGLSTMVRKTKRFCRTNVYQLSSPCLCQSCVSNTYPVSPAGLCSTQIVRTDSILTRGVATKFCLVGTDSRAPKPTYPQKLVSPRISATLFRKCWKMQILHNVLVSIKMIPTEVSQFLRGTSPADFSVYVSNRDSENSD